MGQYTCTNAAADFALRCAISGFRRKVDEACVLLGYYAASNGRDRQVVAKRR
jgi:hypothetical protein